MSELLQLVEPGTTRDPHADAQSGVVGIDLGTTNSLVATLIEGTPQIIPDLDTGARLLPSVVSYLEDQDAPIVGKEVGGTTFRSIKRLIGKGLDDIEHSLPWEASASQEGPDVIYLQAGSKTKTPIEISADILKMLKKRAEAWLKHPVKQAVITVPAYFDEAARMATKQAAHLAGLNVLRLINEPTAAAYAYGLDKNVEGVYAVYDLGGGTFDFSVLKLSKGIFQVLATSGNRDLGGDDFDRALADMFLKERNRDEKLSPSQYADMLHAVRSFKENLGQTVDLRLEINGVVSQHTLPPAKQKQVWSGLINDTLTLVKATLDDIFLSPSDVKGIILVGGSTRFDILRKEIESLFGRPPLTDLNPDETVALGAALQAESLTHGSEHLLLDVTPLSLGLEMMGGVVEKIIHRNTPLPVSKTQEFTTYQNNQTGMQLHVVQGEREFSKDCRSLGHFELTGIPPGVAGSARIQVTYSLDADGLLTVEAMETQTKTRQHIHIKPTYGLDDKKIRHLIEDSLIHGQDDMKTRLLESARLDGKRVLQGLENLIKNNPDLLQDADSEKIHEAVKQFKDILQQSNRDLIIAEQKKLEKTCHAFVESCMNIRVQQALDGRNIENYKES